MTLKYLIPLSILFACGDYPIDTTPVPQDAGVEQDAAPELGTTTEAVSAYPFYGIRIETSTETNQRLCAGVPSVDQKCFLPSTKTIRIKMDTTGMNAEEIALTGQWIYGIPEFPLSGIVNTLTDQYGADGWSWAIVTDNNYNVQIKKGAVGGSISVDDVRSYWSVVCPTTSRGPVLPETPPRNGTVQICNKYVVTMDYNKLRQKCSTCMSQQIHHVLGLALITPAGMGVQGITPGLLTDMNLAQTSHKSSTLRKRDKCAIKNYNAADPSQIVFNNACE